MTSLLILQQATASDAVLAQVENYGVFTLTLMVALSAVIAGLIFGLMLKLVGQMILGGTVTYASAFTTMFFYALISGVVSAYVLKIGLAPVQQTSESTRAPGSLFDALVPQIMALLVLTALIRHFVRDPDRRNPSWGSSLIIAIIMDLAMSSVSYLLMRNMGAV